MITHENVTDVYFYMRTLQLTVIRVSNVLRHVYLNMYTFRYFSWLKCTSNW